MFDKAVQEDYQVFEPGLVQEVDVVVPVSPGRDQAGVLHLADGRVGGSVVETEKPIRERGSGLLLGESSDKSEDVLVGESLEYLVFRVLGYSQCASLRQAYVLARAAGLLFHDARMEESVFNLNEDFPAF